MILHNGEKRGCLKSLCVLRQETEPQYLPCYENEADVVTYQTHSMKMDLIKEEENNLFPQVLSFLTHFFSDPKMQTEIKQHMSKYHKSGSRISSEEKNQKQFSFKKMTVGSKICFDAEVVRQQETEGRAVRGNNKKISIFVMEEEYSPEGDFDSDQIMSEQSVRTIRSIEITHMEMNLSTIAVIYDTPQPFLINLSLCLFIRYCLSARRKVRLQDSSWVLCVATVVAYKLYYDEVVEGLLECFVNIMKISKKDLIDLERCFLEEIDYNTVIRNHDYYFVLTRFIGMPVQQIQ